MAEMFADEVVGFALVLAGVRGVEV